MTNRWWIGGVLETRSPLHIGTYQSDEEGWSRKKRKGPEGEETDVHVSLVCVDAEGHPYLPGRAIKGVLRAAAQRCPAIDSKDLERLFGTEETQRTDAVGGALMFRDARIDWPACERAIQKDGTLHLPDFDDERGTALAASAAIDRELGSARDEKLFYTEFVPAGRRFEVVVVTENLGEKDIALLAGILSLFNQPIGPPCLGAGNADGWGSMEWTPGSILRLEGRDQILEYLAADEERAGFERKTGFRGVNVVAEDLDYRPGLLRLTFDLRFDGPFAVHDPSRVRKGGEDDSADLMPLIDAMGRAVLPPSSVRGSLRSQAERIARTVHASNTGLGACRVTDPADACRPKDAPHDCCLACRTFGSVSWKSPMTIEVERTNEKGRFLTQEFVAIDRFAGGVAGSMKFNAEAELDPVFHLNLTIDLQRIDQAGAGLLALTLRDLVEGDIAFGHRTKDYGHCKASLINAKLTGFPTPPFGAVVEICQALPGELLTDPAMGGVVRETVDGFLSAFHAGQTQPVRNSEQQAPSSAPCPPVSDSPAQAAIANDTRFHNPYHFVPVASTVPGVAVASLHDRWGAETFSGMLTCCVTCESPVAVGSKQETRDDGSHEIEPFKDSDGAPSIPASSLRGLVSSIAEAASNSALRVLIDEPYSRRMDANENLKAVGMIVEKNGRRHLLPLVAPPLLHAPDPPYDRMFPSPPPLRSRVSGYEQAGATVALKAGSFLDRIHPDSFSPGRFDYWEAALGANVVQGNVNLGPEVTADPERWVPRAVLLPHQRRLQIGELNRQALELRRNADTSRRAGNTEEAEDYLRQAAQLDAQAGAIGAGNAGLTRGLLRILGVANRANQLEHKRHEWFIKVPLNMPGRPSAASIEGAGLTLYDAESAAANFEVLADSRTARDETLPFELKGASRNAGTDPDKKNIRLRTGDIVCFNAIALANNEVEIKELAISSIWRKAIGASAHDFFSKVSKHLLPLGSRFREAGPSAGETLAGLTPAERLFGVVEQTWASGGEKKKRERQAFALAGRVRITNAKVSSAKPAAGWFENETPLKILDSPKPPAPSLYFRKQPQEGHIRKRDLNETDHRPHGRKMYLHRLPAARTWRTKEPVGKQTNVVTPIREDVQFQFEVSFENLTREELGLLCYSLRPADSFRHKIGMGKPLGLGSIRIDPLSLRRIDRHGRYKSDPIGAPRYQPDEDWTPLRKEYADSMIDQIRIALERIGDPASVKAPVHYPALPGQDETELFRWFVKNEKSNEGQYLKHIGEHGIDPLSREIP